MAAAVGQTEIAVENIEAARFGRIAAALNQLARFADAARPSHFVACALQQPAELVRGVGMIFHQQDAQRSRRSIRASRASGKVEIALPFDLRSDGVQPNDKSGAFALADRSDAAICSKSKKMLQ